MSKRHHSDDSGGRFLPDVDGSVLVTTAVLMVVLLGAIGFLVDGGFLYLHKRQAQTAADAAAAGAVLQLISGASDATAISEGKYDSGLNGFTNGSNGVTVTINVPPTQGNYTADDYAVEAIVQQTSSLTVMKLLGFNTGTVSARAVARVSSGNGCIYALDTSAAKAVTVSGGAALSTSCGMYINSSNSDALDVSGSACVNLKYTKIVGNYKNSSSCAMTPTPSISQPAATNPLAYLTAPTYSATCTHTNYTLSGGTATISPGTYCGGITESSSGTTLYLNPGLYVLLGGGLNVSGGAHIISNTGGVTFYSTANATYHFGTLSISGGSIADISAPASTSYGGTAGLLYWEDSTYDSGANDTISGGSSSIMTGAIYVPKAKLTYSGGASGVGAWTVIVADTIDISGSANLGNDFSNYPSGSPVLGTAMILSE